MSEKPLAVADVSLDLLRRYNVPGPRYTSYPTAPVWGEDFSPREYEEILSRSQSADSPAPLSLYLHIPFCESLCYFCACTVVISGNHSVEAPYLTLLEKEIDWIAARAGDGRDVVQLHWGGGTPTYLSADRISRLAARLRGSFRFAENAEIGVEVDPRVTTTAHLEALRSAGFNRLSMGVQDFDPEVQKAIHRIQPFEKTRALVEAARGMGFDSINVDLIYGLPLQTAESFQATIESILAIGPDRLAVYSYANVPWLKKHQKLLEPHLPSEREKFEIFRTALTHFTEAGYEYIGMDHFSRPDDELARARRNRVQNRRELPAYRLAIETDGAATFRGFRLSLDDRVRRAVIGNLLCHGVVVVPEIERDFGIDFSAYFAASLDQLAPCAEDGLVEISPSEIRATPLGRIFLRNLAMAFDAYLPAQREKPIFSKTL